MTKPILLSRALAPVFAVLCACLLAFAGPASAFTPAIKAKGASGENTPLDLSSPSATSHTSSTATSGGASIVRTIVGLAIVIAVIWGLAWILRQVKSGREPNVSSTGLASVAALTLGSGRSVHLVRAGNDYVLLGSTEHGVAPIHRYTEEEAIDAGLLPASGALPAEPPKRSTASTGLRVAALAGRILTGAGQGGRDGQRVLSEAVAHDEGAIPGSREYAARDPIAGGWDSHPPSHPPSRPDPMRMPSPSSGLIERMRELTVRR
jgi:flagellar protein FliO/FliZ